MGVRLKAGHNRIDTRLAIDAFIEYDPAGPAKERLRQAEKESFDGIDINLFVAAQQNRAMSLLNLDDTYNYHKQIAASYAAVGVLILGSLLKGRSPEEVELIASTEFMVSSGAALSNALNDQHTQDFVNQLPNQIENIQNWISHTSEARKTASRKTI